MAATIAAIENITKAIDEGRTDVVRGVISVYEKGNNNIFLTTMSTR